ncbi:MAG: hypothetical protein GY797_31060 [Deltaproteobacteria bacterium]|nr:hypothetical protein [Deltaproteobacteria bacterium]
MVFFIKKRTGIRTFRMIICAIVMEIFPRWSPTRSPSHDMACVATGCAGWAGVSRYGPTDVRISVRDLLSPIAFLKWWSDSKPLCSRFRSKFSNRIYWAQSRKTRSPTTLIGEKEPDKITQVYHEMRIELQFLCQIKRNRESNENLFGRYGFINDIRDWSVMIYILGWQKQNAQ